MTEDFAAQDFAVQDESAGIRSEMAQKITEAGRTKANAEEPSQTFSDRVTPELKNLLEIAAQINRGHRAGYDYSFTSILLAFEFAQDELSKWFQSYVREAKVEVSKIIAYSEISKENLEDIRSGNIPQLSDPLSIPRQSDSARRIITRAKEFLEKTKTRPQTALDVRHLMATYVYYEPLSISDTHLKQLTDWGFDFTDWSKGFLTYIRRHFQDESDSWEKVHNDPENVTSLDLRGASPHILSDKWSVNDSLGHRIYAQAIARFITYPKTSWPLCISIQAPWGGGKTSLMRMVQEILDRNAVRELQSETSSTQLQRKLNQDSVKLEQITDRPEDLWKKGIQEKFKSLKVENNKKDEVTPCVTIWFNAWVYENTEQVWAGLADTIVQQIADRLTDPKESIRFLLRLHIRRHGADKIASRIYDRISRYSNRKARPWELGALIGFGASAAVTIIQRLEDSNVFPIAGMSGIALSIGIGVGMTFLQRLSAKSDVKNEPVHESLGEYVDVPDYNNRSVFMSQVIEDIQSVIDSIPDDFKKPIVIFIDDLDRCSPNKVTNVIEAINLFLGGNYFSNCVFVIGMDSEMVAAALERSYNKVLMKLQDYSTRTGIGWRFMDKFVQLPFSIPPLETKDVNKYVQSLFLQNKFEVSSLENIHKSIENITDTKGAEITADDANQFKGEQEKEVFKDKVTERRNIEELNKMINNYSEDDPQIQVLISEVAREFSTNPRDIKRFMNVYRFHHFILLARRTKGLSVPSPEQLARWIVILLKWPNLARWLQEASGHQYAPKYTLRSGEPTTSTGYRLMRLEELGKASRDPNQWRKSILSELDLDVKVASWISNEGIWNFFRNEATNINEKDRLSSAAGRGFY